MGGVKGGRGASGARALVFHYRRVTVLRTRMSREGSHVRRPGPHVLGLIGYRLQGLHRVWGQ